MVNIVSGIRSISGVVGNRKMMTFTGDVVADTAASLARKAKYAKPQTAPKVKVTDDWRELLGLQIEHPNVETPVRVLKYSKQELDFFTEHITGHRQTEIQQALDEILSLKDINGHNLYNIRHDAESLFGKRTYSARALLEAKFNDPQRYDDIMQLLKLHQSGRIKYCPRFIMPNGKLNPIVKEDMDAIINGRPYFQQFKPFTKLDDTILNGIREGDVFSVGEKMYVKDKTGYQLLKMDKKTYELLFPPVDRYAMAQGNSMSCGQISLINNLVQVPSNRVKMYQMFEQNGDKITVHSLGNVHDTRTFDLNNLSTLEDGILSESSFGLKMIEHKGAYNANGIYLDSGTTLIDSRDYCVISDINSTPCEAPKTDFLDYRFYKKNNLTKDLEEHVHNIQNELSTIGNGRTFITIGGGGYKLGMGNLHCCSVYDCQNGILKVANPHGTADCLEIPLNLFYGTEQRYFTHGVFDNI